jgi:hypothetical protein
LSPQSDPDLKYKQWIVLILCFMLIVAGLVLGGYFTILSLTLSLILDIWAFHIKWRARR